jgi:hypothetical protein
MTAPVVNLGNWVSGLDFELDDTKTHRRAISPVAARVFSESCPVRRVGSSGAQRARS